MAIPPDTLPTVFGDNGGREAVPMVLYRQNGNPAVYWELEDALYNGRSFLAATPSLAVTAGNFLHCKIENPAGSGRQLFVYNRRFTNTGTDVLQYQAYVNPVAEPSIDGVIPNLLLGGAQSAASFHYEENTNGAFFGPITGSAEAIPAGGIAAERRLLVIVPEGYSLGFTVAGEAGSAIQAGNVTAVLEFYESQA